MTAWPHRPSPSSDGVYLGADRFPEGHVSGAGEENRTLDIQLGKLSFYH
jgi:hypothetical protein